MQVAALILISDVIGALGWAFVEARSVGVHEASGAEGQPDIRQQRAADVGAVAMGHVDGVASARNWTGYAANHVVYRWLWAGVDELSQRRPSGSPIWQFWNDFCAGRRVDGRAGLVSLTRWRRMACECAGCRASSSAGAFG